MNIVDLVKNQLGGDTISRMGSMLGIGGNEARSAVDAGIPALLAGLAGLAGTPDGARKIDATLDGLDDRVTSNFGGAISGSSSNSIIEAGSKMLGGLFGTGTLGSLGGALSKFTGLSGTSITSLLGLLGPLVLGVLKGQRNKLGLDAGGLANLLAGQKSNIAAAMPAGLGSALSGIPGMSAITGAGDRVADAGRAAYSTGRAAVTDARHAARKTGSSAAKWLVPAAAVIGLIALVWWMANRNPTVTPPTAGAGNANPRASTPPVNPSVNPPATVDSAVREASADVNAQVTRITDDVRTWFSDATDVFTGITDAESARAALPQLQTMTDKLQGWSSTLGTLPAESRSTITRIIGDQWSALQSVVDRVLELPGVRDVLGPAVTRVRDAMAGIR